MVRSSQNRSTHLVGATPLPRRLTMTAFRILPVPPSVADQIRAKRSDDHGNVGIQPTRTDEPRALPCRVCLEEASVGEELLLFSYSPFERPVPYRNVVPIF